MRTLIFLATCLSLIVCVWGNNLILGKRVSGDKLIENRVVIKPRIFGKPQIGLCGATAPPGSIISFVSVTTPNPWAVGIKRVRGGLMSNFIVVSGVSRPSIGVVMKCLIYSTPMKKPTTARPTTTTRKTTTRPTTTTTSTTTTTTEQPSTTESTTSKPTSTTSTTTSEPTTATSTTTPEPTSTTSTTTSKPTTATSTTTPEPTTTTTSEPPTSDPSTNTPEPPPTTTEPSETTPQEPTTTRVTN
ncbi:salivary glue protein Sgs-3-like [Hylaeus anthracinus]|uniref:salivary glue protein Sgs-3-like n=1 Tax=Hylaeus anthracinus TaxID=313031 RepID=UPI0023B95536|nr:salivary glue protein Sgs-3-like [Hylaeus anthracinus]